MKTWTIQPCTTKCLMEIYGVSFKIFKKHIKPFEKEIGKKIGQLFTIKQVITIIEHLGLPLHIEIIYPPMCNHKATIISGT